MFGNTLFTLLTECRRFSIFMFFPPHFSSIYEVTYEYACGKISCVELTTSTLSELPGHVIHLQISNIWWCFLFVQVHLPLCVWSFLVNVHGKLCFIMLNIESIMVQGLRWHFNNREISLEWTFAYHHDDLPHVSWVSHGSNTDDQHWTPRSM